MPSMPGSWMSMRISAGASLRAKIEPHLRGLRLDGPIPLHLQHIAAQLPVLLVILDD